MARRSKRSIPSHFDVRRLVKAKHRNGRRIKRAFETEAEAAKEAKHRIRLLRKKGGPGALFLADLLDRCRRRHRCQSFACPVCARRRRLFGAARVLQFLSAYPVAQLAFVTVINPADAVRAGQLHAFDPKKLVARTRRQLERAGVDKRASFAIGFVDGEWDEGWDLYQPHLHIVAWGVAKADLMGLSKRWPENPRVRLPVLPKGIDDGLARAVLYADKSFWPSVARKSNPNGVYPHGKRRPPPNIEIEILQWLHYQQASACRLWYGAKLYRMTIVKT